MNQANITHEVSIIIPVFNERQRIERLLHQLRILKPQPELIVVEGGSTQLHPESISRMGARLLQLDEANRAIDAIGFLIKCLDRVEVVIRRLAD